MSAAVRPTFRDSAAVVLVRGHGASLEVFWVRRSDRVTFMPGFHAFVGGGVEAEDSELEIGGSPPGPERALRACALREAFEETGILLGLGPADGATLAAARRLLLTGAVGFPTLAREHGWRFRADALVFAGRWRTPPFSATRFDTSYFVARIPEGQQPSVRVGELESGEWIEPRRALDRWRGGEVSFAAPILHTLLELARGEEDLAGRLARAPERAGQPVRRIELKWGIVLQPMRTRPLPPATHTNAYLVGEEEMALIDPGSNAPEELEALFRLTDALGQDGRRVKLVLLTHHHPDHAAGLEAVRARYRVPVAAHPETGRHLRVDLAIGEGERIALAPGVGDWSLRAIHTPGHTRGHLCFFHERTRSLFTGDHIPGGTGTVIIDPPEGDMKAYLASLERLLQEPVETLFPAHGAAQGGAMRRIRWLLDHRREREAKVLAALAPEPLPTSALVERVYMDTPRELWGYAERSLLAHLVKLEAEGRAVRVGETWRSAEG